MKVRTGIDLVDVPRLAQKLARSPHLKHELFSPNEIAYCERFQEVERARHFAARFAAKEAVLKAFGLSVLGYDLAKLEVVRSDTGRPSMALGCSRFVAAAKMALGADSFTVDVSLTHDGSYAAASVVVVALES